MDLISAGRLELGIGAGYSQREYDAFGVDMSHRFDATDAVVAEVGRLIAAGEISPLPDLVERHIELWCGQVIPSVTKAIAEEPADS